MLFKDDDTPAHWSKNSQNTPPHDVPGEPEIQERIKRMLGEQIYQERARWWHSWRDSLVTLQEAFNGGT